MTLRPSSFGKSAAALALLTATVGLGSGCDLVQGFQDAGDALFPEERTHLDAPGLRLVAGNYRDIRFASGTDLYLLARQPEDEEQKLFSMRYSAPRPCAIPKVGSYYAYHLSAIDPPTIAYFQENVWAGSLRFADADCNAYPDVLEQSQPVDGTPEGFVVWSGFELSLFNPITRNKRLLSSDARGLLLRAFSGYNLVFTEREVVAFSPDWRELGSFGQNIRAAHRVGSSVFYEDDGGIHRLRAGDGSVSDTILAADGCELATRDEPWVHYFAPCNDQQLVIYHEPTSQAAPLDLPARPRHVRLEAALGSPGTNPATQPFWFFYLKDINAETDRGTLVVRTPNGKELEIGSEASLDLVQVVQSRGEPYGYALVSFSGNTGTYRYWSAGGEQVDLATRALPDAGRLIVDYDGVAGNLVAVSRDQVRVVAERVPFRGFEYGDRKSRWTALFSQFDGENGTLSILDGSLDSAESAYQASGTPAFELRTVASNVSYFRTAFLDFVLPGILYLSDRDPVLDVGLLEYRNLELGFTAQIAQGVSDFIVTADDVIYSVPYGNAAGIWLLQAK